MLLLSTLLGTGRQAAAGSCLRGEQPHGRLLGSLKIRRNTQSLMSCNCPCWVPQIPVSESLPVNTKSNGFLKHCQWTINACPLCSLMHLSPGCRYLLFALASQSPQPWKLGPVATEASCCSSTFSVSKACSTDTRSLNQRLAWGLVTGLCFIASYASSMFSLVHQQLERSTSSWRHPVQFAWPLRPLLIPAAQIVVTSVWRYCGGDVTAALQQILPKWWLLGQSSGPGSGDTKLSVFDFSSLIAENRAPLVLILHMSEPALGTTISSYDCSE